MANRFTQYRPTEFVQTYDPYPFEEMFKMAQYKQGRADNAALVAGKLAGEMAIESGYFTGDAAAQIMKEREADVNKVTQIAATGNMPATNRAYAEALTRWQKNPMLQSIQSDVEQKKFVDAQMAREGYGNDYMFNTYDSNTGQFTPSEATKAKIANGQKITLQDYGGIENVADIKAFQPYIQLIQPKISDEYSIVKDPTTGESEYRHKSTNEKLTAEIVEDRSKGLLEGFRNDDGTINMELLRATDPEMYKNARWKEAAYARAGRGGQFKWDNLVDDYMNIASLSFYTKGKQNITGVGGDSGSNKPLGKKEMDMFGDIPITYNATTAENDPTKVVTDINSAAKNLGIDPVTMEDKAIGMNIKDLIYTAPSPDSKFDRETYDKEFTQKQQLYSDAIYNIELGKLKKANPDAVVMGVKVSTMDPLEMEQIARSTAEANMTNRKKLAHALYNTNLTFSKDPSKIPSDKVLNDTESVLSESEKKSFYKIQNWNKAKKELNDFRNKYSKYSGVLGWDSKGSGMSFKEYDSKIKELQYNSTKLAVGPQDLVDFNNDFVEYGGKFIPKKYKDYVTTLNNNIEQSFKNPEITTTGKLLYNKDGGFSEAEIPFYHKIVSKAAVERVASGAGMYYKGKPLTAFNTKDSNSTAGHVKADLFIAGGDGTDEAATADFSTGVFLPSKFYFNNANDKWMARGSFSTIDEKGVPIKSSEYDVDISDNMDEFLSYEAQDEIFTTDRAIDILNSTYKGTATVAKFGGPKEEVETYGAMKVYGNPDGTYAISGKIPNESGEVKNIQEVLRDRGENPLSLSKDKAAEYLGDAFKYRVSAIRKDKFVRQEGIAVDVPEAYLPDVSNIFKTIGHYESDGKTGEYNAMNQGSYDAEGTKPKNPGNSFNIIGKRIVDMTVGEVIKHQALPQDDPQRIHAVGKFQFTGPTFKEFVEKAGISHDEKMTPATQQKLGLALIREEVQNAISRGNDRDYLKGRLKSRWVGLRNASEQELESLIDSAMLVGSNL